MMNASTTSTRLHWSHALWRRIRSSMVIWTPSETLMVRQDLQKRQAEADIEARIMERLTLSRATSVSSSRRAFCDLLADVIGEYLAAQIDAGVDAVQVFDSWVGQLNAQDYREFILPHTRRIFDAIAPRGVPAIHFGVGTGSILGELRDAGGTVIGADWRTPLD